MIMMELRWDGSQKYVQILDSKARHIWASATLYTPTVIRKRKQWFAQWQDRHQTHSAAEILHFHKNAGDGDPRNDVVMDREVVKTVSITQIVNDRTEIRMDYHDLVNDNLKQAKITLEGEVVESN
jgi:hypothetical protein